MRNKEQPLIEPPLLVKQTKVPIDWSKLDQPYSLSIALQQLGLWEYANNGDVTLLFNHHVIRRIWKAIKTVNMNNTVVIDPQNANSYYFIHRHFPYLATSVITHFQVELSKYVNVERSRWWWRDARVETYEHNPRSKNSELKFDF